MSAVVSLPLQAQPLCDEQEMDRRWRRALALLPGAPRLWRAYIRRRAAAFGGFSARDLPRLHAQAAAALARQRSRAGPPAAAAALEAEAAALALDGARAALESGYAELGVAMLQVLLEFNLFAPEGGR